MEDQRPNDPVGRALGVRTPDPVRRREPLLRPVPCLFGRHDSADRQAQMHQAYVTMAANGDGGKKIWITELGAPTGNGPMAVSEDAQAAIIGSSLNKASTLPYIGPVFVHSLRDSGTDPADSEQNFGLLRADFTHKPAFDVVRGL
ncbi:hypothetical protein [Rhodococcoides fascians]|uniref:hypothetical protein n=1 Tax=Rhodococcoides fascians TaxID=1828 RepID=UPI00366DFB52